MLPAGRVYRLTSFVWMASLGITLVLAGWAREVQADERVASEQAAAPQDASSGTSSAATATPSHTVPVFSFRGAVTEKPLAEDFPFAVGQESLKDLIARLNRARDDEKVRAVVLLCDDPMLGLAQIEEIRTAIDGIKAAGKEVHAHADQLSLSSYAVLAGATRLSVVSTAPVILTGLYGEQLYLRGLLDKIGVTPDFITCGDFKSAAEMFMRSGPSPEAERMTSWLFDSLFDTYIGLIASGRGVPTEKVRGWIDTGLYTAETARDAGIVDAVEYRDTFDKGLKAKFGDSLKYDTRYGRKRPPTMDMSSPFGVFKFWAELLQQGRPKKSRKDAVAIVYVEGPIVPGKPAPGWFAGEGIAYSTPIRHALEEAARDDSIKAVVLRVNSPGGSAVASEIILEATRRVKAVKPLIVSMGDVAGSGGYYVSCGSDTIFADRSTITASIGVVGGKLATAGMWQRLGVSFTPIQRGENADLFGTQSGFTDAQREKLRAWMEQVYAVFKGHVQSARGSRLKKPLDELAGGRVFTGVQALELGLVDHIGGLQDAAQFAAQQAGVSDYELRVVPKPRNFVEMLLSDLTGEKDEEQTLSLRAIQGSNAAYPAQLVDHLLPLLSSVEPHRAAALRTALVQLELLGAEQAVLIAAPLVLAP